MPDRVPTLRPHALPGARFASPAYYRSAEWFALRKAVLLRDEYRCRVCGRVVMNMPQVDHIIPRRAGGADTMENLQTLCMTHHSAKTHAETHGSRR